MRCCRFVRTCGGEQDVLGNFRDDRILATVVLRRRGCLTKGRFVVHSRWSLTQVVSSCRLRVAAPCVDGHHDRDVVHAWCGVVRAEIGFAHIESVAPPFTN